MSGEWMTPEALALLTQLWPDTKIPVSELKRRCHAPSMMAVIKKARRMGLPLRPTPIRHHQDGTTHKHIGGRPSLPTGAGSLPPLASER